MFGVASWRVPERSRWGETGNGLDLEPKRRFGLVSCHQTNDAYILSPLSKSSRGGWLGLTSEWIWLCTAAMSRATVGTWYWCWPPLGK